MLNALGESKRLVTTNVYVSILILSNRISALIKVSYKDVIAFTIVAIVTGKNTKMIFDNIIRINFYTSDEI